MARRRRFRRRRVGATRFAGARKGSRNLEWLGLNQPARAVAANGTPDATNIGGTDYIYFQLAPTAATPGRAGTHTVLRIRGNITFFMADNATDSVPDFNGAPIEACIFVARLNRNDFFNATDPDNMLAWWEQTQQDDNRLMWQDTFMPTIDSVSDGAATFFRRCVNSRGHNDIDVKVKRRIDFSQYALAFGVAQPTGTGIATNLVYLKLRGLFAASGPLT